MKSFRTFTAPNSPSSRLLRLASQQTYAYILWKTRQRKPSAEMVTTHRQISECMFE